MNAKLQALKYNSILYVKHSQAFIAVLIKT